MDPDMVYIIYSLASCMCFNTPVSPFISTYSYHILYMKSLLQANSKLPHGSDTDL